MIATLNTKSLNMPSNLVFELFVEHTMTDEPRNNV